MKGRNYWKDETTRKKKTKGEVGEGKEGRWREGRGVTLMRPNYLYHARQLLKFPSALRVRLPVPLLSHTPW